MYNGHRGSQQTNHTLQLALFLDTLDSEKESFPIQNQEVIMVLEIIVAQEQGTHQPGT